MGRYFAFWIPLLTLLAGPALPQPLVEIPRPAPGTVEDAVRRELAAAHDLVEERAEKSAGPEVRAAAYGDLGRLYAAYELWEAARASFANARTLTGDGDFAWAYLAGWVDAERAELEAAAASLSRALEIDPESLTARLRLGEVELDLDRADAARESFEAALMAEPDSAAAHWGLARALDRAGRTGEAIVHYERTLELEPAASRVRYPLALAYRRAGRTEAARRQLAEQGTSPVAFPDPWVDQVRRRAGGGAFHKFRGDQEVLAGNLQQAVEAYRKAVAADPDNFYYRKSLGLTLYELGRADEARGELVAAIDLDPGEVQEKSEKALLHYTIASMAANQGVLQAAEQHYQDSLKYDPEHVDALFMLGNVRGRQGRLDEALDLFSKALEADPARSDVRFQRATTLMDLGRFGEAVPELEKKLEATPDDARARQLLEIASERAKSPGAGGP